MTEALLVFVVIILAMALTAGYFYFKQKIDKLEDDVSHLQSRDAISDDFDIARRIIDEDTPTAKPTVKVTKNEIEDPEPESVDITPENMHSIVTNKNLKIVREDVFSDEDNMVM